MWTLLWIGLTAAAGPTFEAQPLTGDPIVGTLVEVGPKQVRFDTDNGRVSVEIEKLVMISRKAPPIPSPSGSVWVELADGSSLIGGDYRVEQGQALLTMAGAKDLEVPTQKVLWVRFQAETEPLAAEWSKLVEMPADGDLLVARKGASIEYHKGTLREVSEATVRFEVDGEVLPIKRANVFGLVYFYPRAAAMPEALCRVADASGSVWAVASMTLAGDTLRWTTPAGLSVVRPLAQVTRIDYSQGKIVHLSDLKPESTTWSPYFGTDRNIPVIREFFGPRNDRSLGPGPIELNKKTWSKGLALHSQTEVVYRLPGKYRRFKALMGIDDRLKPHGSVRLVIRGDDRILLECAVVGSEPAKPVDLDVTGVRRLAILVGYGENSDMADHLDLAEARIVK